MRPTIKQFDALSDFEVNTLTYADYTYPVYRKGTGPAVIVIHEVPNITPEVANFARRVVDAGFTVLMPCLFGVAGAPFGIGSTVKQLAMSCVRKEFAVFEANKSSPVTDFLRGLSKAIHDELGGSVGVLGMCLTGNFALTLALDTWVTAPVLSQPSLPVGLTQQQKAGLHLSPEGVEILQQRVRDERLKILGLRFSHDPLCPPQRFCALSNAFGEGFEGMTIDSGFRNPHGNSITAHSVLTIDLIDEAGHPTQQALHRVLGFFAERLASVGH
ncbi:MAG: dienelactone hydrolase family protein [Pseudomonadota bacterium]|nr:dienelactone hydrolase family protein [Pseudomonadota bacterium]